MQLFIRYPNSQQITINIDSSDTINLLKIKLFQQEQIPFSKQILYWNNQELLGTKTLDDYKISEKSIINLTILPCTYCEIDNIHSISQHYENTTPFLSF